MNFDTNGTPYGMCIGKCVYILHVHVHTYIVHVIFMKRHQLHAKKGHRKSILHTSLADSLKI
jgi:hypothetical protein